MEDDTNKELIADIFGSSDEEEEFGGFGDLDIEQSQKPRKESKETKKQNQSVISDDDDDDLGGPPGGALGDESGAGGLPQLSSDDEADEAVKQDAMRVPGSGGDPDEGGEFVSDFDKMMERRKAEMGKRRRKRKEVEEINESDDLISELIQKMKTAAEDDRELNQQKKPAICKMKILPQVNQMLKKHDLMTAFLDNGILTAITEWLAPLPDRSLPHLHIRQAMLTMLTTLPPLSGDALKMSGIGKAVMYIYKHPKEIRANKEKAGKLINEWSRPIFNLTSNYNALSKEEREARDYEQLPKKRKVNMEGGMTPRRDFERSVQDADRALRPGDKGWVYRARVPQPSNKDYVVRPKWNIEEKPRGSGKKKMNRYEKLANEARKTKANNKATRAVQISIEGKGMQ